jgi:UDPglucose 6-dehydrogenase
VVGLGKLGACLAAALALRGRTVVGVDVRPEVVQALNEGQEPQTEPGLGEAIAAARSRLSATTLLEPAVRATDVTFVVVPTPSEPGGAFSLELVKPAFAEVGRALRGKPGWHLVVLMSTVLPGMTRTALIPVLERASGKRCGADFGVCYSPAFIALGSVLRDFLNPDFVLIGESDARAGEALEALYRSVVENRAPCRRMSLENAELVKIGINTFVTTKIAFANMLAELCERVPGGDVDVVTGALGLDRRIGRPYLTGGLGYGGPCFPRERQSSSVVPRARSRYKRAAGRSNRAVQSGAAVQDRGSAERRRRGGPRGRGPRPRVQGGRRSGVHAGSGLPDGFTGDARWNSRPPRHGPGFLEVVGYATL